MRNLFNETDENSSLKALANAAKFSDAQVEDIISSQVNDRIRKDNIMVTDETNDGGQLINKKLSITELDPDIVDGLEVRLWIQDKDSEYMRSMGRNSIDYSKNAKRDERSYTADVTPFDNYWLTINGQIVSFLDSEIRTTEDGKNARYVIVPVGYWQKPRVGDSTDLLLKDAIKNNKLDVGVLEVVFYEDDNGDFSKTGKVLSFRKEADTSFAYSEWSISDGNIYELLAGYDEGGKDGENLRSIGVISGKNLKTAEFKEINNDGKGFQIEFNIVDIYGSVYSMNKDNFPDDQQEKADKRNLDKYSYDLEKPVITAPVASKQTADQTGITGEYEDRTTKSAGNSVPSSERDTDAENAKKSVEAEEQAAAPAEEQAAAPAEEQVAAPAEEQAAAPAEEEPSDSSDQEESSESEEDET